MCVGVCAHVYVCMCVSLASGRLHYTYRTYSKKKAPPARSFGSSPRPFPLNGILFFFFFLSFLRLRCLPLSSLFPLSSSLSLSSFTVVVVVECSSLPLRPPASPFCLCPPLPSVPPPPPPCLHHPPIPRSVADPLPFSRCCCRHLFIFYLSTLPRWCAKHSLCSVSRLLLSGPALSSCTGKERTLIISPPHPRTAAAAAAVCAFSTCP
ncbi:hypothetical protein BC939DRAFT_262200 [Gamsiella multidivaricata]|uniref:uncharacterized protein n=1 Tax=Gamsiella multidivaricata TaxID=101098 RepID=UPI00221F99E9|nr:uncharacterized protein BC939DRAFT_262200 [Gamsiella multidivaricata]KAI7819502.1 hypothetical protein BC939DRAFT_262200 [Gamsiella multidivaricata]